jgi:hypothetical protein
MSWKRRGRMAGQDELFQMELNPQPNEASGLLMIGNEELLGEHGWDLGFWACLNEGEIEDCVAAICHHRGYPDEEGWEIERLRAEASGAAGKTEDAEAITREESTGYVYILGSHFGGKDGPLKPKRSFVARFREADVGHVTEEPAMELDVSRRSFVLHRLINDALEESGPDLIPLGEQFHKALIAATIRRGVRRSAKSGPASYARTTTRSTSKARPSGRAVPSFSGSASPRQQKGALSW